MGNKGGVRIARMMTQSLDKKTQLQYDALDFFDYGDAPPLSPYPASPRQASAPLQRNIEDDDFDGTNVAMGPVYRDKG